MNFRVEHRTGETKDTVKAEVLKCKYCGAVTVSIDDTAQCPNGCPGNFSLVGKPVYFSINKRSEE